MKMLQYRIRTLFKYSDLWKELVFRDLKLKYRRSVLGYLWSVLKPLLTMIVLTLVFGGIFRRNIENYPVYLLTGRVLYDYLKESTTGGLGSVVENAALLKKVYVPKYIFTWAKVTSCLVDTVLSMIALLMVIFCTGAKFYWTLLLSPLVFVQIYLFCLGLSFFLAQLNVFFRDIRYIYQVVMTAMLYMTPIMYPLESLNKVPELQHVITHYNPLYYYVTQMRSLIYLGQLPQMKYVLAGCAAALFMLFIGAYTFQRSKDRFILYL